MKQHELYEQMLGNKARFWTGDMEVEQAALNQIRNISTLPILAGHVALMPDVHMGMGATVGSVIPLNAAVIPAAVGVDIGCVDGSTEFLSPDGWVRIDEYDGEEVMQYNLTTGVAEFVEPSQYIKKPATGFYWFKTKYGVNQCLSADHKVLVWEPFGRNREWMRITTTVHAIAERHSCLKQGWKGKFKTSFVPKIDTMVNLTDAQLRVMVAVCADGSFSANHDEDDSKCVIRVKKLRKASRIRQLLDDANIPWVSAASEEDVTAIRFYAPVREKSLANFWHASYEQLKIIVDECFHWDGNQEDKCYFTRDKASADFINYAFAACGYRSVMRADTHPRDGRTDYRVFAIDDDMVGIAGVPKTPIRTIEPDDGDFKYQYCFTLPDGFWVMRRGGCIAITGNCGMIAVQTSLKASQLPDDLKTIRAQIERDVPVGFNYHHRDINTTSKGLEGMRIDRARTALLNRFPALRIMQRIKRFDEKRMVQQVGTLGGGNHFIELCLDTNQNVWVMLHSGSRNVGKTIGEAATEFAKEEIAKEHIQLADKDLAWFADGTPLFDEYVEGMSWAQEYAKLNRDLMMLLVLEALKRHLPSFALVNTAINCHHNFLAREEHFGRSMWITRKGAVSAQKGQLGIIPGSMGAKSFIVCGKGHEDAYCSCSHGAGRRMSRGEAKRSFTLADLAKQTDGVECRKDQGVLDEIPGAYKDIDAVMEAQSELVEIKATLKQILCIKG